MAVIKWLASPADYLSVWRDMQDYTNLRGADTPDEIWLCEHAPVYTLGQAGSPGMCSIPPASPSCIATGAGRSRITARQVMAYALFDLRRVDMYVKEYVTLLEGAVIDTLAEAGVAGACRKPGAPGVYVPDPDGGGELAKIAALGIKIRNGRAYHGVSLNVDMDLAPFLGINPAATPACAPSTWRPAACAASWRTWARRWRAIWLPPGAAHGPGGRRRTRL